MTEKMKPSGITWIGEVPDSWNLLKLKYFSYLKGRIGWQGLTADEFIDEGPYLITGTDFENGRIQFDRSYHISEARYAQAPEIQLQIGDLLVTKDGTVGKMAYVDELPDKASLNSHLLLIRPLEGKYHNRFLFWLMSSSVFTGYTEYSQDGTIMASLSQEKIGNFLAYFPSLEEQCAIADFLDIQCAKIDSVIADIEKQIETLQKYKKSLITEAVTKGLDRSVPTKNSGIDWIGEIPVHWKTIPLKHLFSLYAGGDVNEYDFSDEQTEKYKYPIYSNSLENHGLFGYTSKYRFSGKTFTVTGRGEVGKAVPRFDSYYPIVRLLACIPKNNANNEYYAYCVNSADVLGDQTAMAQLTTQKLGMLVVPLPSADEQKRISDYLNNQCAKTDAVIDQKREQLSILLQHKKSLIYEYVTGKKRVTEVN